MAYTTGSCMTQAAAAAAAMRLALAGAWLALAEARLVHEW
jgi:hypothetical protein